MNESLLSGQPFNKDLDVTPDMSAMWLDKNAINRVLNWGYVLQLARDMKAGRFACTHQGIAFDTLGNLIDGQHRLWAVLEADVTVRMRVFFNEPSENFIHIDGHRPRQAADRMSLNRTLGMVRADELATLRALLSGISLTMPRRTLREEMELLEVHRPAIRFAHEQLLARRPAGLVNAMTRAGVARAWYCVNSDEWLIRFCEVLRSGLSRTERERPIVLLRDQLLALGQEASTRSVRRRQYALTTRAISAYLLDQPLKVLRPAPCELFLLPEDVHISA